MKKLSFLFLIMLLSHSFSKAQQKLDIKQIQFEYIDFPTANKQSLTQPISNIDVLDARPDNFCLGFIDMTMDGTKLSKKSLRDYLGLVPRTSLQNEICKSIIPMYGSKRTGFNILLAIKELWLYDNDNSSMGKIGEKLDATTSGLLFRADVYLERGESYIPLFQMDSIFISHTFLQRSRTTLMQNAFSSFCKKLSDFPLFVAYEKATKIKTKTAIDSFYNHFQQLRLIDFTDTVHQFVFKTFDDFKNGIYSSAILSKYSDKLGDYYYKKNEKGIETIINDYAFVEKGNICIKTKNTYSPIFINNNRIYTIGSKFIVERKGSIPLFMPLGPSGGYNWYAYTSNGIEISNNSRRDYQLMMLDMKTGNVY